MAEDIDVNEDAEQEDKGQSIWDMLDLDDPGDEPFAGEQEDQDEQDEKEDKLARKLSAKMDNMSKKFEQTMLRERAKQFTDAATDLEKDLFKTIAADVKNLADFDRATTLVHERSIKMQAEADKYREQMEQQAAQQAARAWGSGPVGTPVKRTPDYEEKQMEKIAAGDVKALFESLVGDDAPFMV